MVVGLEGSGRVLYRYHKGRIDKGEKKERNSIRKTDTDL